MDNFDLYEWNQKRRQEHLAESELEEPKAKENTKLTNISSKNKK